MIKAMDKETARELHKEANALFEAFAKKHGLCFVPQNAGYDDLVFRVRAEFKLKTVGGVSTAQAEWNKYCRFFGLTPEQFGSEFKSNGKVFRVEGILPRRKRAILAVNIATGKQYVFDKIPA